MTSSGITYISRNDYLDNGDIQHGGSSITNTDFQDATDGYVWVKQNNPKMNRCDVISGLEEIQDADTCLNVASAFLQNEFTKAGKTSSSYNYSKWGLLQNGNTNIPSLPIGCSIATSQAGSIPSEGGTLLAYQSGTDSGSMYNDANRIDLKICKVTPVASAGTPVASANTPAASAGTPVITAPVVVTAASAGTPVITAPVVVTAASANTPVASAGTPVASANTPVASANTPVASANTPVASAGTPVEEEEDYKMYYIIGLFICFIITMGVVVTLKRVKS